ncbi:cobalt-precorrin-5B (C(1))-methyltransferase [Thaumasiovibrio sp. DFM-14]|uniref:cobalt-precorrin-5B (C(1))-methyltransferase n=1 Tax=Thaumasiovibrio sp. DFM-14 TaxID=3384792 RepID=UPI00399F703A
MGKLKRSKSNQDLRGGFTTGAFAAAAARAAVKALIERRPFSGITIQIPNRDWATFSIHRLDISDSVLAGVIKDAGDDPDCTHGLEIQCLARLTSQKGISLQGGRGVAVVTKPGLELPVGRPAINPVPYANIVEMAKLEWLNAPLDLQDELGIELTIIVPQGELAAKETINARLGLIGGISILGTRGTVKPYSTSAYAASVRQSIQIANANQLTHVVLTTGSRSENAAKILFPELDEMALIQAGDFIGIGLRAAKRYQLQQVTLVTMIGKMGKLISGRMMTHVSGYGIDFDYLSQLALEEGISSLVCAKIAKANTGRHALDLVREQKAGPFFNRLCYEARQHVLSYINNALEVDVVLIDFNGQPLGRCCKY